VKERYKLLLIGAIFATAYFVPWDSLIIRQSGLEAFMMLQEYAREHVLTCLIPAFFIAGAIAVFVSQASVLKYFGAKAKKLLSYSVASVSGTGAGGVFLHGAAPFRGHLRQGRGHRTGHRLSIFGTGHQRAGHHPHRPHPGLGAGPGQGCGGGVFAIITGLLMAFIFRKDDARAGRRYHLPEDEGSGRSLWQEALFMLVMVLILVFAAFARPGEGPDGSLRP
jgi:hypothetical protein